MRMTLYKIIDNREFAIKYHEKTRSKYTTIKRVMNSIMNFALLIFFMISVIIDSYILLLLPAYIVVAIILNILDYWIRKKQLEYLLDENC